MDISAVFWTIMNMWLSYAAVRANMGCLIARSFPLMTAISPPMSELLVREIIGRTPVSVRING